MKCVVNWIPLRIHVGSRNTQPHLKGLHSTQLRHHTQIDLLTCRVCFVKHMMISPQVHHHTHLDLTTCRVCFVKHMMIIRQYFPQLWYDPYP